MRLKGVNRILLSLILCFQRIFFLVNTVLTFRSTSKFYIGIYITIKVKYLVIFTIALSIFDEQKDNFNILFIFLMMI